MSATQTLELVKELKPKLGERATTKLLDFVENQNGELATKQDIQKLDTKTEYEINGVKRDVFWLKWIVGIGFTFLLMIMLAGFAWLRADMQALKTDMDRRFTEQKVEIDRRFTEQKSRNRQAL